MRDVIAQARDFCEDACDCVQRLLAGSAVSHKVTCCAMSA